MTPSPRTRRLTLVAVVGCVMAVAAVAVALQLRRAPAVHAPSVEGLGSWERRADAPVALTEVAAAAFDGRIWVAGGLDESGAAVALVQIYDPETDSWAAGPALPDAVHHAALVADPSALLLIGGYSGSTFDRPTDAVWRLEMGASEWAVEQPLLEPRGAGAAAWNGDGLVVYAGGIGPAGISGNVFVQEDHSWRLVGSLGSSREHLAATSDGAGNVYALGGRNGIAGNLGTVDVIEGTRVRSLASIVTPRGGVAAFFHSAVGACLVGGEEPAGTRAEVECVRANGSVVALPSLGVARHGLGAAVLDGAAYVLLGGREPGLHVSAIVEALRLPPG